MHATILTLLPDAFPGILGMSLAGKALKQGIWSLDLVHIRDFGITKHKKVDDEACGGGNGLIMRPDVLGEAIDFALKKDPTAKIIYPSPRGKYLNQAKVKDLSLQKNIIILCGRFEGIDERVLEEYNIDQISVGDYILSGGEIAAFCILDSIIRLLPGVLTNQDTLRSESFEQELDGLLLLEHPLYTKPALWRGRQVPQMLLSGHHGDVKKWRLEQAIKLTQEKNNS